MIEITKQLKKSVELFPNLTECKSSLGPIQDALYVLGGKWRIPILVAMLEGNKHFGEIQRTINKISAKVLSHELKELELNGFITRRVYGTKPVSIEYELTEYTNSLGPVIVALREWGLLHREKVKTDWH
ncbi:HxlR family transcriptional regulator [Chryseobacterium sp. Leaf405]|uniref:winged helix-turn-helix transcriptional regulator n=1 Tax=Chryseobacterium sp. Leaf405 TaxID=1736367 RepID=UPI000700E360|nr:helix-turn-helix domain-containing protein [Chryseobacterium sp. Leaf405]KQT25290.1 HxlR family transcriptional regulator [Chryseobacterium sp. Leaf405]